MRYLRVRCEVIVETDDDDLEVALEDGNWECNDLLEIVSEAMRQGHFTEITDEQAQNL